MAAIEAVIFDMDGTLVDSEAVSQHAWEAAGSEFKVDVSLDLIRSFIGRPAENVKDLLAESCGDRALAEELFDAHLKHFLRLAETELELKPGAREALDALSAAGIPVALATSTAREWAVPRLERFGLVPYFSSATFGDEIENGKPAPDIFLRAAEKLGVEPARCAAVEDSHNGVRSGHAAGMHVFMVPDIVAPTPEIESMCEAVLESLLELPAALRRAGLDMPSNVE